jgi:hypothetical protein
MNRAKIALIAVCTALISLSVGAEDRDGALARGIAFHDAARLAPNPNIEKGKAALLPLIETEPLAKAYYGSLITLEASEAYKEGDEIKSASLLVEGTRFIDEAIVSAPDNPDLRFIRLVGSYEISTSSPMNRYREMKVDLDWFDVRQNTLSKEERATVELYRGLFLVKAKRLDDALDAFDLCVSLAPDSDAAKIARKQLALYGE